jgi:hypothetical protein
VFGYGMSQDWSLDADVSASALEKLNVIEIDLGKNGEKCMSRSETCFESEKVNVNVDVSVSKNFDCRYVCWSIDLYLFSSS